MSGRRAEGRLRVALRAYPRAARQAEGDVLISLARDMVDGGQSSVNREALGLLQGGLLARAGDLADVPWGKALHRAGLPIAAALLALNIGMFSFWIEGLTWPGWSWILVVAAPALAVFGLLGGWRSPLILGAALICLLGVAQGNGLMPAVGLQGDIGWPTGGFTLPPLACAIPAGILLLAAGCSRGHRASRSTILATLAWVIAGAIAARLLVPAEVTVGSITLNGVALCMATYGIAAVTAMVVGTGRRRRDPAGMLAGILGLATVLPVALLYAVSSVPLGDNLLLLLLALSTLATTAAVIRVVRLTPT